VEWTRDIEDALAVKCDITSKESVLKAKEQVLARFGRVDVLVNNAGIVPKPNLLENIPEEDWKRAFDINVNGTFFCTQVFGVEMFGRDGAIVNLSSTSGLEPGKHTGAYSATKAAVIMITKQTAIQWGENKVRCNAVSPGLLLTDINRAFYEKPGVYESRVGAIPLGHLGEVEDIANAVFFLASPEARYINGANLVVDGGFVVNGLKPLNIQVD
jgi:NAD(P)-dependent dehydrogenase (short-subunit alcohol dehydrogenase family)